MKKSDTNAIEPAKSELEAPVQLTPEQLETVAGGMLMQLRDNNLLNLIRIVAGNWPVGPILNGKSLPGGGMFGG
jgi:hypothetical protein